MMIASCAPSHAPIATPAHVANGTAVVRSTRVTIATARPSPAPAPSFLVHVDDATDVSRSISHGVGGEVTRSVRRAIEDSAYATSWPGGLPRSADLESRGARAFVVVPTVHEVAIERSGGSASIRCRVGIRVAPWRGVDGGETWEVATAATAMGSARATTSARTPAIEAGIRDCLREVAETVATHRIVPFLKNVDR